MSSRLTKKSLVNSSGRFVKTPRSDCPTFAFRTRRPPTSTVISGAVRVSNCARSTSSSSAARRCPFPTWLRNPSAVGSSTANDSTSVCSCTASVRPGEKGTSTSCPACFAARSTAAHPPRTITSASETRFPPVCSPLKPRWIPSKTSSTFPSRAGWFTSQSFCGARRMRAPLAPPRLSLPRNVEADAQAVETSWDTDSPESRILLLSAATSSASINS